MHSYFETLGKYLLFTKYLTSTNMPTAQQEKRAQKKRRKVLVPHCPDTVCHNYITSTLELISMT